MFSNSTFSPAVKRDQLAHVLAAAVHVGGVELEVAERGVGQVAEPREAAHDADRAAIADQQVAQHGAALGLDDASDVARLDAGNDDVGEGGGLLGAELEEAVRRRAVDVEAGEPKVRRAVADREKARAALAEILDRPGLPALEQGRGAFSRGELALAGDRTNLHEDRTRFLARDLDEDLTFIERNRPARRIEADQVARARTRAAQRLAQRTDRHRVLPVAAILVAGARRGKQLHRFRLARRSSPGQASARPRAAARRPERQDSAEREQQGLPAPHVPSFPSDRRAKRSPRPFCYETLAWTTAVSTDKSVPRGPRRAVTRATLPQLFVTPLLLARFRPHSDLAVAQRLVGEDEVSARSRWLARAGSAAGAVLSFRLGRLQRRLCRGRRVLRHLGLPDHRHPGCRTRGQSILDPQLL